MGIVITSTEDSIKVEFGNYFPDTYPASMSFYNRNTIEKIKLYPNMIMVHLLESTRDWELSYDGSEGFQVDSINGIVPTSNEELFNELGKLIKA